MATPNPLSNTYTSAPPKVSSKTFHIAGILTTVYGLEELSKKAKSISCLWLLHPRLQTKAIMDNVAAHCISDWNQKRSHDSKIGLIAVSLDQRNHGSRQVTPLANESWREKNETHAQDMFSIYHGTATDTSLLIDHLESYVFHDTDEQTIDQHLVLGISLGGHAAWQVLFSDERVTAAVIIIGCPDYMRVMSDRARLSKRQSYTSSPNGANFLGSKDFPNALVSSIKKSDPRGLLFGTSEIDVHPSKDEQDRLRKILDSRIKGKSVLVCSGGDDKLVPYHCAEPFMNFLKTATSSWYKDGKVYVEDNVYPGVGHAYSEDMARDASRFVSDIVGRTPSSITSKM